VQIMFVSAHDDLETLMKAFDAGGNDFIPKNAAKDVLLRKVDIAREAEVQRRQLKMQLSYAQQTAFTAMSSLGETGIVLQFLRSSFHCLDPHQLGALLIETLNQFNVRGLARLSDVSGEYDFSVDGLCTPLECSILSYVAKLGRINQASDRLILNYPHITLMITDLDIHDADGVGRLRDHLALIAEGAGVRIDAMEVEQQRLRQANLRMEAVKELVDLLSDIENHQNANHSRLETLIEQHRIAMEHAFVHLGLTDSQELLLHDIVDRLTRQLDDLFENDSRLALRLIEIVDKQRALLNSN